MTSRSWTQGRTAIVAASEPSRLGKRTRPPLSGTTASARRWTFSSSSTGERGASRFGWSWLPPMMTAGMPAPYSSRRKSKRSASASGEGVVVSKTSPATRRQSTASRRAISSTSLSASSHSSRRERARRFFPRCQSPLCRNLILSLPARPGSLPEGSRSEPAGDVGRGGHLLRTRGPGGEGELDQQRYRDLRLVQEHVAGLEDGGAGAGGRGQEAVLAALRLRGVQAADHAE